jgi:hypothetical protein
MRVSKQQKQQREADSRGASVTNAEAGVDVGLPRKDGNVP